MAQPSSAQQPVGQQDSLHRGRWALADGRRLSQGDGATAEGVEGRPQLSGPGDRRVVVPEAGVQLVQARDLTRVGLYAGGEHEVVVPEAVPADGRHGPGLEVDLADRLVDQTNVGL